MRQKALAYVATHNVMTLATSGPGEPWAAAVFYASRELDLYFVSSPRSRHASHLQANPKVAAAIHEDYRDWRAIRGIQLSGTAVRLHGTEREAALALKQREVKITIDLHKGKSSAAVWTCDLSYEYIKINAAYRS